MRPLGGSVRLKRPMRPLGGSVRLKRPMRPGRFRERVVVSHISRKTSEMWGTRHRREGRDLGARPSGKCAPYASFAWECAAYGSADLGAGAVDDMSATTVLTVVISHR